MSIVKGSDFIGLINVSGIWTPQICSRSISLTINTEQIETSVSGNGLWATYAPTKNSFTGTIDGIVSLAEDDVLTLEDLQEMQMAQTIFQMQFKRTDLSGNVYVQLGYFFITSSQDTGSFDGIDTFSISLQGTGELKKVHVLFYTETSIGTSFADAHLVNVTVIQVNREGRDYAPIITAGSPVGSEVKYTAGTGTITFPTASAPGNEIFVVYY